MAQKYPTKLWLENMFKISHFVSMLSFCHLSNPTLILPKLMNKYAALLTYLLYTKQQVSYGQEIK